MKNHSLLCFGAGAVGSLFCGLLAKNGFRVDFVARGAHLEEVKKSSILKIDSYRYGYLEIFVNFYEKPQKNYDIVFICTKSQDTADACLAIRSYITDKTIIVSMQNGIDNPETIRSIYPKNKIVATSVFVGASIERPGFVKHSAEGRLIIGKITENVTDEDMDLLQEIFTSSEIPCQIDKDIKLVMWKKLLWNLIFNPLSALLEATCGKLVDNEHSNHIMKEILKEGVKAASLEGIIIPQEYLDKIMNVTGNLYYYKTSMLQDIEKLKIPEVDGIMLPVIKRLKESSGAPYTETVYNLLKFKYGKKYIYTPKLTVDVIVYNSKKEILLIERKNPPYGWALPGGFVDYGETVEDAAKRELREETGITLEDIKLLGVYSDPRRDVRFHTVSIVYYGYSDSKPIANDDAKNALFFSIKDIPDAIAFDHRKIIEDFVKILL
ncbi:MAG: 2-dehydropantoate 2-reductase [Calditerrivibrio sp.]|nr:2-dehydropantoate 2-reductase [Calditerrivibrio sp.]